MKATVGFILFYKVPNHMVSSPNKLFEYMAAGMAVIASDIPMWKEIIEKYECGICVDPQNVEQICDAILFMKNNPDKVREMGKMEERLFLNILVGKMKAKFFLNVIYLVFLQ